MTLSLAVSVSPQTNSRRFCYAAPMRRCNSERVQVMFKRAPLLSIRQNSPATAGVTVEKCLRTDHGGLYYGDHAL